MHPAVRRFALVLGFELALVVVSLVALDRLSPLVLGVAILVTTLEVRRLRHTLALTTPPEVDAAAPGTMLLRGRDAARAEALDPAGDDVRTRAMVVVDVKRGDEPGYPYLLCLHDELRHLVDEFAIGYTDPGAWVAEGPIGDALLAQPDVASICREDFFFIHVRAASPAVGPRELHAAAVRAVLDAHQRYGGYPSGASE